MPLFSRFKSKGTQAASKKPSGTDVGNPLPTEPAQWQSRWESATIVPEEIKELVHVCTAEMKTRAEALDAPFMLLPFRPDAQSQGARIFIRNFYKANSEQSSQYRGESLKQELRLTDSLALCSILKWCWSRMPNGVVSWPVYEGFQIGEKEAKMARNAFDTFVPIGADSEARRSIIVDFYDLLAAVAAHGKNNGLGGRKVSRLAGWWAFEHSDDGKGFEGGYKSWTNAADASSHLFFAYLRSLSPETNPSMNVIERIPRSLQALLASTEYPPDTPSLLQRSTPRVVMMVDTVSPTPFALLRRAKNFEFRDRDQVLRQFAEFEDPIDALTDENKRVLYAISAANQSTIARSRQGATKPDETWSAFQNLGFGDIDERALTEKPPNANGSTPKTVGLGLHVESRSGNTDGNRPTTPSWADFLSAGFPDDRSPKSPTLLYPPAQVLPPLASRASSPGLSTFDEDLTPGELAAITNIELDDAFWWVWMTSLAAEEPSERKAVFGRCALIETTIANGAWLIMEEQVKGASPEPLDAAYIAPKKSIFSFAKRARLGRKRSIGKNTTPQERPASGLSATPSKTSITTDQHAKIKAAARALTTTQENPDADTARRGRHDDSHASKTSSTLTLGIQSEAGPAMQWAKSYDKHAIRQQYLGDSFAGKGMSREELVRKSSSNNLNNNDYSAKPAVSPVSPQVATHHPEPPAQLATREPPLPAAENSVTHADPLVAGAAPDPSSEPTIPPPPPRAQVEAQPAVVPAGQHAPISAFEKEMGNGAVSSLSANLLGRKVVPPTNEHPAYRNGSPESPKPTSPKQNPAALAAQRAMLSKALPESPERAKAKKQAGTSSGLKKLFGKKRENLTEPLDFPRVNSNALSPPSESSIGRRLSLMRRKHGRNASSPRASQSTIDRPIHEQGAPSPVILASHGQNYPPTEASRNSIHEHEVAEHEFSRFDQGPLEDMPAVMPDDSEEPSPLLNSEHRFDNMGTIRQHSDRSHPSQHSRVSQAEPGSEIDHFIAPALRDNPADDRESEVSMDDHHDAQVVQDRWATIRENAHKRAERTRASEDHQSLPSQSLRTDDGETSGEETIESRVARIKARVAELTGNMDGVSARH